MTVSKISTEPHAQGEIEVFRLANAAGAYVDVCNIGAGVTAVVVPDREGRMADVAAQFEDEVGGSHGPSLRRSQEGGDER